jgi:glutaryl-CoA dehydrogenase
VLDYGDVAALCTSEELHIQRTTRDFLVAEAAPHIRDWWDKGTWPGHLVARMGALGLLGPTLPPAYGGAGASAAAYGLVMYELERIDSSLRSFASVQSALCMYPIFSFGSDEQKRRWLPELGAGRAIGCFGLTEADGGSDPVGNMRTHARRDGADFILTGSKMWITNGGIADVAVVWARDDADLVRGFLIPRGAPGFQTHDIARKMSLRASVTSELVLDDVRVPAADVLPGAEGMKAPLACLTQARFGIVWGVLGALEAVYSEALDFARSRTTFGRPIAARQLVQDKLVRMVGDHTKGLLLAWRLARLKDEGKLRH